MDDDNGARFFDSGRLAQCAQGLLCGDHCRQLDLESLHLPLYTIWSYGSIGERAFAVVHCTGGDLLIALASLMATLLLVGRREWPNQGFARVAVLTLIFGIAYTGFSEWHYVFVRKSWAYAEWMPVVPVAGVIGLSPLLQWIVNPLLAFWAVACVRHVDLTST